MATLVLVHGAWLGGWVWQRVAGELRARGHTVFAPTLTGLGEREHLLGPDVDLDLHVTDLLNLLGYEDLQRVTLVGHGYGGVVVQRAAALAPERTGRLVFLDALLAAAGASLYDTLGAEAVGALATRAFDDEGVMVYGPDAGLLLDGLAKRDADWVEDRLTPMPVAPYAQRVAAVAASGVTAPVLYVRCAQGDPLAASGQTLARGWGWPVQEIAAGHLPMIGQHEPVAELLDNFVRQPASRFSPEE